uniref:Uncharacterized protein n=1 Tax=Rhizophora mucronata TaxID=61149 RepID=A0A2P2PNE2_RHIMU
MMSLFHFEWNDCCTLVTLLLLFKWWFNMCNVFTCNCYGQLNMVC